MRVSPLVDFIKAREAHRAAKERGWKAVSKRKPDPIISEYRFCNVRRNDDRVTLWIHKEFFDKWGRDADLWFALVVARLFNNEDTLREIMPFTLPFKPERMRSALHTRARGGKKNFNAAYIVSTNGRPMDKVDYVVDIVLQPLWDKRKLMRSRLNTGQLANAHIALCEEQGLGSFMAAQILADLKYAPSSHMWEDFATFAASGPGSRRGLNRVMGYSVTSPWNEVTFRETLAALRDAVNKRLTMEALTAQDIQNCLCEFDKYERARTGDGRPKQKYTPAELPWESKP